MIMQYPTFQQANSHHCRDIALGELIRDYETTYPKSESKREVRYHFIGNVLPF